MSAQHSLAERSRAHADSAAIINTTAAQRSRHKKTYIILYRTMTHWHGGTKIYRSAKRLGREKIKKRQQIKRITPMTCFGTSPYPSAVKKIYNTRIIYFIWTLTRKSRYEISINSECFFIFYLCSQIRLFFVDNARPRSLSFHIFFHSHSLSRVTRQICVQPLNTAKSIRYTHKVHYKYTHTARLIYYNKITIHL